VLAEKLKRRLQNNRTRLSQSLLIFKPDTVLKWHRELVKRKWTFNSDDKVGRPRTAADVETWVVRLAQENVRWGADRIQGELSKLGIDLGATTIRDILARHHIPPAPQRCARGNSWGTLLNHYKEQILAGDFFIVETAWLQTI
jgi:putative transposase